MDAFMREIEARGILGQTLEVVPLFQEDGVTIARLRPLTKAVGLSLGDRACLALGLRIRLPVLTTDREWQRLELGVEVVPRVEERSDSLRRLAHCLPF